MLSRSVFIILISINYFQLFAQEASFDFNENDYVNISSDASLQASTEMTIECWVKAGLDNYSNFAPVVHYFRLEARQKNQVLLLCILKMKYAL